MMESNPLNGDTSHDSSLFPLEHTTLDNTTPNHLDFSCYLSEEPNDQSANCIEVLQAFDACMNKNVDTDRNVETRQVIVGSRDRMSMVMEESDEELIDCNIHPSSDELDAMLVRNSMIAEEIDEADVFESMGLPENDLVNRNFRHAAISDAETIDEHEITSDIDVQRPMGERWGETNYATVLRQSVPHAPLRDLPRSEPTAKVIPVRSAPRVGSAAAAAAAAPPTNESPLPKHDVPPRVLDTEPLEFSSEHISDLNEPPVVQIDLHAVRSRTVTPVNSAPKTEAPLQNDVVSPRVLDAEPLEISAEHISHVNEPPMVQPLPKHDVPPRVLDAEPLETSSEHVSDLNEPPVVQPDLQARKSQTLPTTNSNSTSRTGTPVPMKPIDRTRCYACTSPVYMLEGIHVMGRTYHKKCFRCHKCQRILSIGNYSVGEGNPYCQPHYMEVFRVTGRYAGASMKNYDELLLHQSAIQSSTSSEHERERPPAQLTRTLVAKFQQMCTDSPAFFGEGRCPSLPDWERNSVYGSQHLGSYHTPSPKTPIPTPFHQAGQLIKAEAQRKNSTDLNLQSPVPAETAIAGQQFSSSDCDLPNPGITRDMVAKFSALSAV